MPQPIQLPGGGSRVVLNNLKSGADPPIDLLRPFESEEMQMSPANQLVGNVRNNGPEMLNSA
jgi:putative SOS response-associated peptidase YedK